MDRGDETNNMGERYECGDHDLSLVEFPISRVLTMIACVQVFKKAQHGNATCLEFVSQGDSSVTHATVGHALASAATLFSVHGTPT